MRRPTRSWTGWPSHRRAHRAAGDLAGLGAVGASQRHDRRTGRRRPGPAGPRRDFGVVFGRSDGIVRHRTDHRRAVHGARPNRPERAAGPCRCGAADVRRTDQRADPAPGRRLAGRREIEIGSGASPARAARTRTARRPAGLGASNIATVLGTISARGDRPGQGVPGVGL